ncbi:hypothetical protein G4G27_11890 [Sphingomonas sp. So64.6b]|uniref:KAP family P-loop NTPase fold protein n=1 Tax=Sphingomonas sp. So64.6b TaxID=2997354 RepID=UPI0016015B6B|nr:P-loop NTPase fold protein [Sphingomonas sp. So64.6b]QNA84607.1 hypothetical protein G4G27_11890 [Sphingomonas sp. So64.6b]
MESLDEIWKDDLLDRRLEAEDLLGYLESIAARPVVREDGRAHVLAVDARYGEGKTYFLRRFVRHMAASDHPVAFVDAWVDDLENEPLVALAATLELALEPYTQKHVKVRERVTEFTRRAGKVSAIVAAGVAKRGLGLLITQGAVAAIGNVLEIGTETVKDVNQDAAKTVGQAIVDDASATIANVATPSMAKRITSFREGQKAIEQMKAGLADVVASLADLQIKTPIVIVIDELDRCRPTYAVKLLEEIKHLFDVAGVAFVLGLHGAQLTHSINAAYGVNFDSAAYLRRFFNRRYNLRKASLLPIVQHLISLLAVDTARLDHHSVQREDGHNPVSLDPASLIADYIRMYGLSARDAFAVMESLQTALALTKGARLQLGYLMPLLIAHHLGSDSPLEPTNIPMWQIARATDHFGREWQTLSVSEAIRSIHSAAHMDDRQLSDALNNGDFGARIVVDYGFRNGKKSYYLLQNYHELVRTVACFE